MRLAILADDLTGACDTGIQFVDQGFRVSVKTNNDRAQAPDAEIVVVSTASRSDSPLLAASKVREAQADLVQQHRHLIYKKVDSTLQGNLGVEIAEVLQHHPDKMVVFCPAFPAMGRQVIHGELNVDTIHGVQKIQVSERIQSQVNMDVMSIGLHDVRQGSAHLVELMELAMSQKIPICCADAENDQDVALIAQSVMSLSSRVLPVGSAGLAYPLAQQYARIDSRLFVTHPSWWPKDEKTACGSVVYFVGSRNEVTKRQLQVVVKHGPAIVTETNEVGVRRFSKAMRSGSHVIVHVHWGTEYFSSLNAILKEVARNRTASLVVTGGDTLQLICNVTGATGINLQEQIDLGMAKGQLVDGLLDGTVLVTKAGGFGRDDTLFNISAELIRQAPSRGVG